MNFLKGLKDELGEILNKDNVKRIGISNSYFEVEFFDKGEKTLKAGSDLKIKKAESDLKIKKIIVIQVLLINFMSSHQQKQSLKLNLKKEIENFERNFPIKGT